VAWRQRRAVRLVSAALGLAIIGLVRGDGEAATLRVCADPDNAPFTSADPRDKGMYLELAELIADRMGTRVEPFFFRTDGGRRALRPTLAAGRCDVFIGLPDAADRGAGKTIALTRPFLDVGYVLVAPPTFVLRRLDDLDGKTVGVLFASTPQTLLSVRDRVRLATFKSTDAALDALGERQIDAAFLWGPEAGYRAAQRGLLGGLKIVSVTGLNLRWRATIGVRAADQALRDHLDRILAELEPAIVRLAAKYHFPLDTPVDLGVTDSAAHSAAAAPAPPPSKANPFRGDSAAVATGRMLFNTHCSHCHSPNAANPEPRSDLRRLNTRYGEHADEVFYTTVTQGRPAKGMPPWGPALDDDTIWKIKTFLESVQRSDTQ
jgi:polar amino acid transport system substrate-binding protein